MQKPTFSLDCSDAAEHIDLPPTEFREVDGFHLLAQIGDVLIVCVHDTNGESQGFELPLGARECLPDEDDLQDHFERLLRAPLN